MLRWKAFPHWVQVYGFSRCGPAGAAAAPSCSGRPWHLRALVGLLPGVDDVVLDEVRSVAERLLTLFAFEGFFARVGPMVADEGGAVGEGLATLAALVGLLPVCTGWCWEVGPALEGLAASAHLCELLPGVDEVVADERGALAEGFPTRVALVGLHARVNPLVAHRYHFLLKAFPHCLHL